MQRTRMIGDFIRSLAKNNDISNEELSERLSCNVQQIEDLFAGRYILPFWKFKILSDLLKVPISQLLDGNLEDYNENYVHCINDFKDLNNREKILDIIDDYLDIKEMLNNKEKI